MYDTLREVCVVTEAQKQLTICRPSKLNHTNTNQKQKALRLLPFTPIQSSKHLYKIWYYTVLCTTTLLQSGSCSDEHMQYTNRNETSKG